MKIIMESRLIKIKNPSYRQGNRLRNYLCRENLYITLLNDGCEDFYNYITWLDIDENFIATVLPVISCYCYIPEELEETDIIINLKPINLIKDLKAFFVKMRTLIPEYSYLTGYFENNDTDNLKLKDAMTVKSIYDRRNGKKYSRHIRYMRSWVHKIVTRFFNKGISNMLTKKSATSLLEDTGFTVMNITGLNGKTYFCAQKTPCA